MKFYTSYIRRIINPPQTLYKTSWWRRLLASVQAHPRFIFSCTPSSLASPDHAQMYCKIPLKSARALPPVRTSRGTLAVIHQWSLTGVQLDFITLSGQYNHKWTSHESIPYTMFGDERGLRVMIWRFHSTQQCSVLWILMKTNMFD